MYRPFHIYRSRDRSAAVLPPADRHWQSSLVMCSLATLATELNSSLPEVICLFLQLAPTYKQLL